MIDTCEAPLRLQPLAKPLGISNLAIAMCISRNAAGLQSAGGVFSLRLAFISLFFNRALV